MGLRADIFEASLKAAGYDPLGPDERRGERRARSQELPEPVRRSLVDTYRELGGIRDDQEFTTGRWDVVCRGGLTFEFDEDLHFNEYRATTLRSEWSAKLPWTTPYLAFSGDHRELCLRAGGYGGKWANASTEKMFGSSDPVRTFSRNGSSRWKQRALYDAVKDAYALYVDGASLVRISIHDQLNGKSINATLNAGKLLDPGSLRALIDGRTVHA